MESSDTEEKKPPQKSEHHYPQCRCDKCYEYRDKVKKFHGPGCGCFDCVFY